MSIEKMTIQQIEASLEKLSDWQIKDGKLHRELKFRTLLFETDRGELNAIVYEASAAGQDCWDFQFRTDVDQEVTPETHCRVD